MNDKRNLRSLSGAIEHARNFQLEEEFLGIPLWLVREKYPDQAVEVLNYCLLCDRDLFVRHQHRQLFDAYVKLAEENVVPTHGFLKTELLKMNAWDDLPGSSRINPDWLNGLADKGGCNLSIRCGDRGLTLARDIKQELEYLPRKRSVIHLTEDLLRTASDNWDAHNIAKLLDDLRTAFYGESVDKETLVPICAEFDKDILELERLINDGTPPANIFTGFSELDKIIGGLLPGNLITLGARPAMGKTALALDIAWNCVKDNRCVAYFTFEMTRNEIARRLVAKECQMNVKTLRETLLEPWQLLKYKEKLHQRFELPLMVDERNTIPHEIEAKIELLSRKHQGFKVDVIILDHLQIMGAADKTRYERRDRQIATYTGQLKDMAKRLGCAILLLSQLNRDVEKRPPDQRHPRLSDFRESGAIEQDSDIILGLYRKYEDTKATEDRNHATVMVLKNRSGPTRGFPLTWLPETATFRNPSGPRDGEKQALEPAPF